MILCLIFRRGELTDHTIFNLLLLAFYFLLSILCEPLKASSVLPLSIAAMRLLSVPRGQLLDGLVLCQTVLLAILPEAQILAPVRPLINAVPMLLIVLILALILLLVGPDISAKAVHVPSFPLAYEVPTILPLDHAVAIDLV